MPPAAALAPYMKAPAAASHSEGQALPTAQLVSTASKVQSDLAQPAETYEVTAAASQSLLQQQQQQVQLPQKQVQQTDQLAPAADVACHKEDSLSAGQQQQQQAVYPPVVVTTTNNSTSTMMVDDEPPLAPAPGNTSDAAATGSQSIEDREETSNTSAAMVSICCPGRTHVCLTLFVISVSSYQQQQPGD